MYNAQFPATITCGACGGTGHGPLSSDCASCDAAGRVSVVIELDSDGLAMLRASLANLPPTPFSAAPSILSNDSPIVPAQATPYPASESSEQDVTRINSSPASPAAPAVDPGAGDAAVVPASAPDGA